MAAVGDPLVAEAAMDLVELRSLHDDETNSLFEQFVSLYQRTFTDRDITEDPDVWRAALATPPVPPLPLTVLLVAVDRSGGQPRVVGGCVFEYYRRSKCALLAYIVTDPTHRKRGVARLLMAGTTSLLRAIDPELRGLFAETERFELDGPADELDESARRLTALGQLGWRWLQVPYVQPPLSPDRSPARNLLLMAFPLPPGDALSIPRQNVVAYLHEFYAAQAVADPEGDPDLGAMAHGLRQLATKYDPDADRVPYADLPMLEAPTMECSRVRVTLHAVTEEQEMSREAWDGISPETGSTRVDGQPAQFCPYFHSFETDVLSYRFQHMPPLDSVCEYEAPEPVTIHLPEAVSYLSEGRQTTLLCTRTSVPALVNLSSTRFRETGVRIWHVTFRPRDPLPAPVTVITSPAGPSRAPAPNTTHDLAAGWFTELDVIKLIKLYNEGIECTESLLDEIGFSVDGRQAEGEEPVRLSFGGLVAELTGGDVKGVVTPKAGTVAIDPDDPNLSDAEQWRDLFTKMHGVRHDDVVSAAEVDLVLGKGEHRFLEACCGIANGIFDYHRMAHDELIETLTPNVPIATDVILVRKGTLMSLNLMDEMFDNEVANSTIGTNPYLLIPHSVILQNEYLVDRADSRLDQADGILRGLRAPHRLRSWLRHPAKRLRGERPSSLANAREDIGAAERDLRRLYVPNIFQYPTERGIYDVGHSHRGADDRKAQSLDKLADVRSSLEDERQFRLDEKLFIVQLVTALLGVHAVLQVTEFLFVPEGRQFLQFGPPNLAGWTLIAVFAASVWVLLRTAPRRN
jgi:GNAT superfamily N-acetyltransferase